MKCTNPLPRWQLDLRIGIVRTILRLGRGYSSNMNTDQNGEKNAKAHGLAPTRKRMEPAGSGATWTGSLKGVFAGRKHHKPRLSLNNNTAGVREREDTNCTRVAGSRDGVEGVVPNMLRLDGDGAVGFIDFVKRRPRSMWTAQTLERKPQWKGS